MQIPSPASITSQQELRDFTALLLPGWISALDQDRLRLHLPQRRCLMRLIPSMVFHLGPELFLQISGSTTFEFPEETCQVKAGEICLVSRGLPHRETAHSMDGPFFTIVFAYLSDAVVFHVAREGPGRAPTGMISVELKPIDGAHFMSLLKDAADWFHQGESSLHFAVKGSLMAHLSLLLAAIKQSPTDAPEPLKVMQVRQLLLEHLFHPEMSVNWIGRSLKSSPEYLSRLFRETTGKPLAAHITERRMARARDLLASTALNISEVSRACGYDDPSYFTRVFRKEVGRVPREFRDGAMKNSDLLVLR